MNNYYPLRPKENEFEFVYIDLDGSVRELDSDEQNYLSTDFLPNDGNLPYIKSNYKAKGPNGEISGFIRRRRVPKAILIRKLKKLDN